MTQHETTMPPRGRESSQAPLRFPNGLKCVPSPFESQTPQRIGPTTLTAAHSHASMHAVATDGSQILSVAPSKTIHSQPQENSIHRQAQLSSPIRQKRRKKPQQRTSPWRPVNPSESILPGERYKLYYSKQYPPFSNILYSYLPENERSKHIRILS